MEIQEATREKKEKGIQITKAEKDVLKAEKSRYEMSLTDNYMKKETANKRLISEEFFYGK